MKCVEAADLAALELLPALFYPIQKEMFINLISSIGIWWFTIGLVLHTMNELYRNFIIRTWCDFIVPVGVHQADVILLGLIKNPKAWGIGCLLSGKRSVEQDPKIKSIIWSRSGLLKCPSRKWSMSWGHGPNEVMITMGSVWWCDNGDHHKINVNVSKHL